MTRQFRIKQRNSIEVSTSANSLSYRKLSASHSMKYEENDGKRGSMAPDKQSIHNFRWLNKYTIRKLFDIYEIRIQIFHRPQMSFVRFPVGFVDLFRIN